MSTYCATLCRVLCYIVPAETEEQLLYQWERCTDVWATRRLGDRRLGDSHWTFERQASRRLGDKNEALRLEQPQSEGL